MKQINGRVWKFGDNIDTDVIIPACHLVLPLEEMKVYAMTPLLPEFAGQVTVGDVIVAGKNFGCGSSREQAPAVLKALGIRAIVAKGLARIFFRNAINLGLPVIECSDIYDQIQEGDLIEIDPAAGKMTVPRTAATYAGSRLPGFLLDIVASGGLIPHLAAKAR